jgi:hypothetical protein
MNWAVPEDRNECRKMHKKSEFQDRYDSIQRYLNDGLRAARNGAAQLKPGET